MARRARLGIDFSKVGRVISGVAFNLAKGILYA
jgi:hypothetical protein